jgi:tetratricopeptide (TPR) repeat protein
MECLLRCSDSWGTLLSSDQPGEAEEQFRIGLERWPMDNYSMLQLEVLLGRMGTHLYVGRPERALECFDRDHLNLITSLDWHMQLARSITLYYSSIAAVGLGLRSKKRKALARRVQRIQRILRSMRLPYTVALADLAAAGAARLRGNDEEAVSYLERAEQRLAERAWKGWAASARLARGRLLGGDEGERLAQDAVAALAGLGAKKPERLARFMVWHGVD